MKKVTHLLILLLISSFTQNLEAQEKNYQEKITILEGVKTDVVIQEKEALKLEIKGINKQLKNNEIDLEKSSKLKEAAAKKHALNIENNISIIDSKISLLKRNQGEGLVLVDDKIYEDDGLLKVTVNGERIATINSKDNKEVRYDRRTYFDPIIAVGLNNTITDGQSLNDSPYKIGGSRFVEMGWAWRTRVFENSNALRINYGVSFQFNVLKPKNNEYFVTNNGQVELEEFEFDLSKSKFRTDNLVFPVHLEFGPSKFNKSENKIRYSLRKKFRIGLGGYAGFNIGSRQKLKYTLDGKIVKQKIKGGYNTSNLVYGLSSYIGLGGMQLYAKYDLNPVFKNAKISQNNVSLGLRFDL